MRFYSSLFLLIAISALVYLTSCGSDDPIEPTPPDIRRLNYSIINDCSDPFAVSFDVTVLFGDNLEWIWDFGDGETGQGENPIHFYNEPGIYSGSLTVGSTVETFVVDLSQVGLMPSFEIIANQVNIMPFNEFNINRTSDDLSVDHEFILIWENRNEIERFTDNSFDYLPSTYGNLSITLEEECEDGGTKVTTEQVIEIFPCDWTSGTINEIRHIKNDNDFDLLEIYVDDVLLVSSVNPNIENFNTWVWDVVSTGSFQFDSPNSSSTMKLLFYHESSGELEQEYSFDLWEMEKECRTIFGTNLDWAIDIDWM